MLLSQQPLRKELVNLYFERIHDKHHSLFHQPTFMQDIDHGQAPEVIVYAMMALAARFSTNEAFTQIHPWERGRDMAKKSEQLLNIRDISLTTVQACVLLGTVCFAEAEVEAEALYYSVAIRLAQILNLAHRETPNRLEREINLRVWWSLYMIDIWSSTGIELPRQINTSLTPCPLLEETAFSRMTRENSPMKATTQSSKCADYHRNGLWSRMIPLTNIFGDIHDLNERTVKGILDHVTLKATVHDLGSKLENWRSTLPTHMRMSATNMASYASKGFGRTFVALHLGYHHYSQLLYYQFLDSDRHSILDSASTYASQCKVHATALCDLLYDSYAVPGCECFYIMIGHMLVVSSTVLIHTLLFSAQEEMILEARRRLEKNFEILTRLQEYWPSLELSLSRLWAFHNTCRASMDTSFRMDQWMLRFLLEHGARLKERPINADETPEAASGDASQSRMTQALTMQAILHT